MGDDAAHSRELLLDAFGRVREQVQSLAELPDEVAFYRPGPAANSISWLLWHLTRIQDDHVADAAGVRQRWSEGGWCSRMGLPFPPDATGYGQSSEEVGQVRVGARLLADYHADVHAMTCEYVMTLTAAELERIVDRRWDPPVTVAVRLVSVLGDCLAHLGQADYARGLAETAG
jgi:hypothetical protein